MLDYRNTKLDDLATARAPYATITPDDVRACFAKYDTPEARMRLVLIQKAQAPKVTPLEQLGPVVPPSKGNTGK